MRELAGIKLYDVTEVSDFLGMTPWTINKMCRERIIKAKKVGKEWGITEGALREYLR